MLSKEDFESLERVANDKTSMVIEQDCECDCCIYERGKVKDVVNDLTEMKLKIERLRKFSKEAVITIEMLLDQQAMPDSSMDKRVNEIKEALKNI